MNEKELIQTILAVGTDLGAIVIHHQRTARRDAAEILEERSPQSV